MQKPRSLHTWNSTNTHIIVQAVSIEKLASQGQRVVCDQLIGKCHFEGGQTSLSSSTDGWVTWEKIGQTIDLAPLPTYQTVALIHKEEEDAQQRELAIQNNSKMKDEREVENGQLVQQEPIKQIRDVCFAELGHQYAEHVIVEKWKVHIGDQVHPGSVVGYYATNLESNDLICRQSGTVIKLAESKIKLPTSEPLLQLELTIQACKHLRVDHGKCVYCGQKLVKPKDDDNNPFPDWQFDESFARTLALEVIKQRFN